MLKKHNPAHVAGIVALPKPTLFAISPAGYLDLLSLPYCCAYTPWSVLLVGVKCAFLKKIYIYGLNISAKEILFSAH